ncbi:uncharacterized protein LOC141639941 [Silene latifolia]|uniref:uncharacterized protein LOC141639941 n=1 Tax=Silene latifolia TaxID=37657 RepID=UPI003D78A659
MEITDWDSLALAFYQNYFPREKTQQLRSQITGFRQNGHKSLFEAWERYKELQRECPHHGLDPWFLAITFYNGCCAESHRVLDFANNERFDQIDTELAHSTIESMAVHDSQYVNSRNTPLKDKEEDTTISLLKAQVALLQQQMDNRGASSSQSHEQVNVTSQVMVCEACGGAGHCTALCRASIEEVNAFQSFRQNPSPFSNTYNEATKYHPNLSYKSTIVLNPQHQIQNVPQQPEACSSTPTGFSKSNSKASLSTKFPTKLSTTLPKSTNSSAQRQQGQLPPQGAQPHDTANAITLRSGTTYDEPLMPNDDGGLIGEESGDVEDGNKVDRLRKVEDVSKKVDEPIVVEDMEDVPPKKDDQVKEPEKIQVTVPFIELITQIPSYTKLMKDILTRKRTFDNVETIAFTAECSALLQNKSPPKLKDPGSFSIPCTIGTYTIDKALCDLGASSPMLEESCYFLEVLDVIDVIVDDSLPRSLSKDPLEALLLLESFSGDGDIGSEEIDALEVELDGEELPLEECSQFIGLVATSTKVEDGACALTIGG